MIENVNVWDFIGCGGVVALVYGAIRAYVGWWLGSPRAARTAARVKMHGRRAEIAA